MDTLYMPLDSLGQNIVKIRPKKVAWTRMLFSRCFAQKSANFLLITSLAQCVGVPLTQTFGFVREIASANFMRLLDHYYFKCTLAISHSLCKFPFCIIIKSVHD